MFREIEELIIEVLRQSLKKVPKENIGSKLLDMKISKNLPAIAVHSVDFKTDEVGVGRSMNTVDKEVTELFNGNSKKLIFTLSKKPVKPILYVEHPIGRRLKEGSDFFIDYEKSSIRFNSPPEKGTANIAVKYRMPAETKALKFYLKYCINVWAADEAQRDEISVEVIKTLLKEEEAFSRKGALIKLLGGSNIREVEGSSQVHGKTLEYSLETYLSVEVPVPRIERVEVEEKRI